MAAEQEHGDTIRVGYYENEVFQEGAAEGDGASSRDHVKEALEEDSGVSQGDRRDLSGII